MPKFAFKALDTDGREVKGLEEALTANRVYAALIERGLHPLEVNERKSILQFEITREKVPRKDLMHFSRQLAVFIRAGIPVVEAIDIIESEADNKVLKKALAELAEALKAGGTFAGAAAQHPEVFPNFYIGVLRAAELTGKLDEALEQLSEYIERDVEARRKITSALIYPAVVMVLSLVTVLVMTIFVLPRFEKFFESLDAELPFQTRILLNISRFMGSWGWLVALALAALLVTTLLYLRTEGGKARFDALLLRAWIVGDLARHAILERFCRVMASMVQAGVPLPEAMALTADGTNNAVYKRELSKAREAMIQGEGLTGPLSATNLFPSAARQMIRVGEETGTLEEQLHTAAAYYEVELDYKIKRFTGLFEPAVIIFMGVVVGFVAVALVSAMYGIFNQVELD